MAEDSILHKVTGFIEIEKPDLPVSPDTSSRPNPVPAPRPPLNSGGQPNLPPWVASGGIPWQPGSATARPPGYRGSSGDSGGYLLIDVDSINAFIQSGGIPQNAGPPPAPMIGM